MEGHLKTVKFLAEALDSKFHFMGIKFGLDPLIGLFPVIGDFLPICISLYMIWIGIQAKLSGSKIALMLWNILLDFVLGLVPVVGDAADFVFKANKANYEILEKHMRSTSRILEGEIVG